MKKQSAPSHGISSKCSPFSSLLISSLGEQYLDSSWEVAYLELEANQLGRILDFVLALLLVALALGLVLVIGIESKSTLVIGGLLHTQHLVKCGFPFMTLFQVFLQRKDLGLELFYFLYMVSRNTSTRGSRSFIIRAT